MKSRRRIEVKKAEIPISSMIDVVFLLLIYFLVVQKPIIEETMLKAALPGRSTSESPREPNFVKIDVVKHKKINGHNFYRMNGNWWKDDRLFSALKKMAESSKDTTVIINCGPNAKHEKLISLLDACAVAELKNINIVNDSSIKFDDRE